MSWHLVQEGLFLYTHNVSPYDGGIFHQVPPTILNIQCKALYLLGTITPAAVLLAPEFLIASVRNKPVVYNSRSPWGQCLDANSRDRPVCLFKTLHFFTERLAVEYHSSWSKVKN